MRCAAGELGPSDHALHWGAQCQIVCVHAPQPHSTQLGLLAQGAGGPTETYEPGPFNGRPAAAHLTVGSPACADPSAVSPTSQAPFWLGLATSAYQIEVGVPLN